MPVGRGPVSDSSATWISSDYPVIHPHLRQAAVGQLLLLKVIMGIVNKNPERL